MTRFMIITKLIELKLRWLLFKGRIKCKLFNKHTWYHFYEIDETEEPYNHVRECQICGKIETFDIWENRFNLDNL